MIKSNLKEIETVSMPPSLHELIMTLKPSNANRKLLQQAHHRFYSSPVFASPSEGVKCDGCLFFVHVPCGRGFGPPLVACGTLCTSGFVDDVMFSYSIFPYLHFPTLHTRTCVFHPCIAVLEFSILVFSTRTHFATLYFTFPYLHFPVLAISVPPFKIPAPICTNFGTIVQVLHSYQLPNTIML